MLRGISSRPPPQGGRRSINKGQGSASTWFRGISDEETARQRTGWSNYLIKQKEGKCSFLGASKSGLPWSKDCGPYVSTVENRSMARTSSLLGRRPSKRPRPAQTWCFSPQQRRRAGLEPHPAAAVAFTGEAHFGRSPAEWPP